LPARPKRVAATRRSRAAISAEIDVNLRDKLG
jgi:hypothetical protein